MLKSCCIEIFSSQNLRKFDKFYTWFQVILAQKHRRMFLNSLFHLAKSSYGWSQFWLHHKINPPPPPHPPQKPLKSQIPNGREKRMKRKHHYKQTILSTLQRHLCLASRPRQTGLFCAVRFPSRWNKSYTTFVSGLPAARGLPWGMPPTPVKSSRCRVRSDNKITCPDSWFFTVAKKTKFTDLPLVTIYWPVTSLLPCTSWAVTHLSTHAVKNPCVVVVLYYSDNFRSALPYWLSSMTGTGRLNK